MSELVVYFRSHEFIHGDTALPETGNERALEPEYAEVTGSNETETTTNEKQSFGVLYAVVEKSKVQYSIILS